MADISKILLPSGVEYTIKDTIARQTATGGIVLRGTTSTPLTDEATTNPIVIDGGVYTAVSSDAVFYGKAEFVFDGTKWHEFGDMSGLGALALKDDASGSYTPAGAVSQPTFTGTEGNISAKGTPSGSIGTGSGTANYTPAGSVSAPTLTVSLDTDTKYVATSVTGGGSVSAGVAAQCTLPTLTMTVENETLNLAWTAGSFTANTPTAVTLPSFSSQTIATGVDSATATAPTFSGTGVQLTFTGTEMTASGTFTPTGTVSQPTFTGTADTITVS